MVAATSGLADWLRGHGSLTPVPVEKGESGMALLILWEVDHGCSFPTLAGDSSSQRLLGFTRRLKDRVGRDSELREWLDCRDMNAPLAEGLAASHHTRWAVQISPPQGGVAVEWYRTFTERWKSYLLTLTGPRLEPSQEATSSTANAAPARRSGVRRGRTEEAAEAAEAPKRRRAAAPSRPAPQPPDEQVRKFKDRVRPPADAEVAERPKKRQATLGAWLQPQLAPRGEHGRANEGPPT